VLGGRVRQDAGRVGGHDFPRADRVEIQVVDADGVVRDHPKLRPGRFEECRIDGDGGRDDDPVGAGGDIHELEGLAQLGPDLDRHAGGLVDARP
jgi:hypothetical protein